MGQLGGICPVVLKIIIKIVFASKIAVKYLLKDLKTLQQEHQTWLNYKHNISKHLVGIAPAGAISFYC